MALPTDLTQVAVTGIIGDAEGHPLPGVTMVFDPDPARFTEAASGYIGYGVSFPATVDPVTGAFSVNLVASDDPDLDPQGWTYTVTVTASGMTPDTFHILVSASDAPTVPITQLLEASPSGGTTGFRLTDLADYDNSVAPTNGQVPVWNTAASKWKPGTPAGVDLSGYVQSSDSRLSDHRIPTAHASTHASGGSDPVTVTWDGVVSKPSFATVATTGDYGDLAGKPPAAYVTPEQFGAVGDGVHDDTTAINNAIAAAVSAAASGSHYAEVRFSAKTYLVNGATSHAASGNAIIPLPVIGQTGNKITLALKGAGEASALPHWYQTVGQKTGTVIKTTLTGTNSGSFGEACIIGGPNTAQGYGKLATYSNMMVVVDGISLSVPNNPSISGFDFSGVAEATIISASCFVDAGPADIIAPTEANQWTFGLRMPFVGNNANNTVWRWACEGLCYGLIISELSIVYWACCVYCITGIVMTGGSNSSTPHRATIFFCTVQWCQTYLQALGTASPLKLDIWMLDIETSGGGIAGPPGFSLYKLINDASNTLQGVCYIDAGGSAGVNPDYFNGASQFRVIASNQNSGAVTAPAVPATTVPQQNRFLRDAAVYIAGGTVSDIKVDGASIGVTSGMVLVPAGKSITLTYSAAPTWKWTLL